MKKTFILGMLASSALLLTSCLDSSGEPTGQISGFFTVENTTSNVVLHMDGGGTIYPTLASVSTMTNGKGMGNVKRAWFFLSYPESGYTQDAEGFPVVREAELMQGQELPVKNVLTQTQADAKKLTEIDSISDIISLDNIWGYNGYITTVIKTNWLAYGDKVKVPTMNLVVEENSDDPRTVSLKLLLNLHKTEGDNYVLSTGQTVMMDSFDAQILSMNPNVMGTDSITVNFTGKGIKDGSFKIATSQLRHKF